MTGGKVIEVAEVAGEPKLLYLDVRDTDETCGIYIEKTDTSLQIQIGDDVCWKFDEAIWSPAEDPRKKVTFHKIGFSGQEHPARE